MNIKKYDGIKSIRKFNNFHEINQKLKNICRSTETHFRRSLNNPNLNHTYINVFHTIKYYLKSYMQFHTFIIQSNAFHQPQLPYEAGGAFEKAKKKSRI